MQYDCDLDIFESRACLKFEIPTMIITDTRSIFQKRIHRIRKHQNGLGSSDSSSFSGQTESDANFKISTINYLKNTSSFSLYDKQSEFSSSSSYIQTKFHLIYEKQYSENQINRNIFEIKNNHNQDEVFQFKLGNESEQNLQKFVLDFSISKSSSKDKYLFSGENRLSQYDYFMNMKEIIDTQSNESQSCDTALNEIEQALQVQLKKYNLLNNARLTPRQSNLFGVSNQQKYRNFRKWKIRQKAEQLLLKYKL